MILFPVTEKVMAQDAGELENYPVGGSILAEEVRSNCALVVHLHYVVIRKVQAGPNFHDCRPNVVGTLGTEEYCPLKTGVCVDHMKDREALYPDKIQRDIEIKINLVMRERRPEMEWYVENVANVSDTALISLNSFLISFLARRGSRTPAVLEMK